jgi:hypothetical protein
MLALLFVRAAVLSVRSLAPISLAITIFLLLEQLDVYGAPLPFAVRYAIRLQAGLVPVVVQLWAVAEALFLGWYLHRRAELQQHTTPAPLTDHQRQLIMQRTLSVTEDPLRFVSGWFKFAPVTSIRRGNALEWASWSMYSKRLEDINPKAQAEVAALVRDFEARTQGQLVIPEGYEKQLAPIRVSLDPISALHRPVVSYAVTYGAHLFSWLALQRMGFSFHRTTAAGHNGLGYWYRPPSIETTLLGCGDASGPIVLLHGIGMGLAPYLRLIGGLIRRRGMVALFLPEFPHISQRFASTPLNSSQTAQAVKNMLCAHEQVGPNIRIASSDGQLASNATFVVHSFGSLVLSWLIARAPTLVAAAVLLDPVSLLLQEPDVAYNFIYRRPTNAIQWFFKYFVVRAYKLHVGV